MKEVPKRPNEAKGEDDGLTKQLANLSVSKEEKNEAKKDDDKANEEVESDEGNESEDKGDSEEEEKVIESVGKKEENDGSDDDDDETCYTGKGPIQQKRVANNRSNPYAQNIMSGDERLRQKMAAVTVSDTSSLNLLQKQLPFIANSIGSFKDDSHMMDNILVVGGPQGTPSEPEGKPGIPALPDMSSMTKNSVGGPRIIIRGTPNPDGTCNAIVLPTPLFPTVDAQHRKIGIWLPRQALPIQALPLVADNKLEILIQLDVKNQRVIRHLSSIGQVVDKMGQMAAVIMNQFVELRPFISCTGEAVGVEGLLDGVDEGKIESALNLVNGKDLTDLLKTYGPNEDSMLMTLCCKKDESPDIRAQVFALVARILSQKDPSMRANVVQKNSCHLSALDYTTVTNNRRLACFLAELYYVLGEDVACPDNSGNTLMHVMARKGDVSAETLQALLNLRLSHDVNRKVYKSELHNNKQYLPIHHAAMSKRCPNIVIQTLQRDLPSCMTARTEDGSAPIHLACQYTSDPGMLAILLYYNRDVVNMRRCDGFTPLHLLASRNDVMDRQYGLIPLEEDIQVRMIRLLMDHGADRSIKVDQKYTPFDLIKVERERARGLLKLRRGDNNAAVSNRKGSPKASSPHTETSPSGGSCGSPTAFQMSPASATSPSSTACNVMGTYDPFIGGAFTDSSPHFAGGSVMSDCFSDGGSNSDSGGENDASNNLGDATVDLLGEAAESDLDMIVKTWYNHPTIQAVMNGAAEQTTQNNL